MLSVATSQNMPLPIMLMEVRYACALRLSASPTGAIGMLYSVDLGVLMSYHFLSALDSVSGVPAITVP